MTEHFLSTAEWPAERLERVLAAAAEIKAGRDRRRRDGLAMGLVFFDPSLRTRTSFEMAVARLGGHTVTLDVGAGVWQLETADGVVMDGAAAEHVREAAPVLSRYVDVLGVRAFPRGADWPTQRRDPVLNAFARHATVPVVNLESALWHPCQALADALTWRELGLGRGDRVVLSWAWHPKALPLAVPLSVMTIAAQRGLDLTVLRPEAFALPPEMVRGVGEIATANGGAVRETDDLAALDGARVVYAKSWGAWQVAGDAAADAALRADLRHWQVTPEWMARTDRGAFMHCLPVRRNVVVADAVLDSPASVVVDQAENRLHAQQALLLELLGGAS